MLPSSMPAGLCAVLPGARCLRSRRRTPRRAALHPAPSACISRRPVARSHLFVPKCVADKCELTAKKLPQFATGRGTYIVPSEGVDGGEVAGTRGLFPSKPRATRRQSTTRTSTWSGHQPPAMKMAGLNR